MKILLSNDDGVHAQGIHELANELRDLAEVIIVAPDRNRSGASNSLTLEQPLRVQEIAENTYSVQGTPTDCVHFALNELLKNDMPVCEQVGNANEPVLHRQHHDRRR